MWKRRAPYKIVTKLLSPELNTQVAYTGKELSICFNVKDQSKFDHEHDVYATQIALMRHAEKTTLARVVLEVKTHKRP